MGESEMGSRSFPPQNAGNDTAEVEAGDLFTSPRLSKGPSSKVSGKQPSSRRKHSEKSILDDIMGDAGDFGDMGDSDVEVDGGRWEDTLRDMEQDDRSIEEELRLRALNSKASNKASGSNIKEDQKPLETKEHMIAQAERESQDGPKADNVKASGFVPASIIAAPFKTRSKRYFIIKSLNYHNIEKSFEKGIWATQAMNERILNEAFETAERVVLIFSVNMSGHFQGYAVMTSPIGRRRVNVWSEANWGGTFSVEWIRIYELPFQKTLHLKNPLNSYKPVKISRDCQELTEELGEALCALIDEGAESDESSKRNIHLRGDYFAKKAFMERSLSDNSRLFRPSHLGGVPMGPLVYPPESFLHTLSPELHSPHQTPFMRSSSMKYQQGSSSNSARAPLMPSSEARAASQSKQSAFNQSVVGGGGSVAQEEDLLNMSYEEYLQRSVNPRTERNVRQDAVGVVTSPSVPLYGATGWTVNSDVNMSSDDPYAKYLANWYANQQSLLMQHESYHAGGRMGSSSHRGSSQPP